MADFKQSLQAAQRWLHRAEDEWEREHGIRAKLHLMLAEAELKRASGRTRKNVIAMKSVAFCLTAVMIIAYGYWSFSSGRQAEEKPLPPFILSGQEKKNASSEMESKQKTQSEIPATLQSMSVRQEADRAQAPVVTVEKTVAPTNVKSASAEKVVSEDEMQGLVRTAGKALRNQPKMVKE